MENISKAVIMAGGVLIAVGVISLALYFYGVMRGYISSNEDFYTVSQIQSFNRFYESYSKNSSGSVITGADMQNIYNKAVEDEILVNNFPSTTYKNLDPTDYLKKCTYSYDYDLQGRVSNVKFSSLY